MYVEIIEFQDNYIRVLIAMISKNSNFSTCQTVLKNVKNIALCTHMFLYKLRFIVVQKKKLLSYYVTTVSKTAVSYVLKIVI